MVLPEGQTILTDEVEVIEESFLPSKTYKLDLKKGRCGGKVDGIEAIEQSIYKIIMTNRFEHLIYSDDYGFEKLTGKDRVFVKAELPRRIKEAILQDDRISSVEDIKIEFEGDSVFATFTCVTTYGDIKLSLSLIHI